MFLSVSPQIREASSAIRLGRDHKGSTVLFNYYNQVSQIQSHTLTWMHEIVPTVFKLSGPEYTSTLHKILLLESPETYAKDQWPPESERVSMLRMISEIPLHQDSIWRVVMIGLFINIRYYRYITMIIINYFCRNY